MDSFGESNWRRWTVLAVFSLLFLDGTAHGWLAAMRRSADPSRACSRSYESGAFRFLIHALDEGGRLTRVVSVLFGVALGVLSCGVGGTAHNLSVRLWGRGRLWTLTGRGPSGTAAMQG